MWKNGFRISFWLLICQSYALSDELFNEKLFIRPLNDGRVYTHFSFKTLLKGRTPRTPRAEYESQHYTVFPLALGQIIREYSVTEMHLSLNAGKWDYDSWGYPQDPSVGSGAELWAWMRDSEGAATVHARWQGLRNALAGLFCASLGELDEHRTTYPMYSFRPQADLPDDSTHRLIYFSHPSERVCTENLTPFLKLLPCKSQSGIAMLLNPHRLFDADWHGMNVHVLWHRDGGMEVELGVQAVFDPIRLIRHTKRDWTFLDLFERSIDRPCPVAKTSLVSIEILDKEACELTPEPDDFQSDVAQYNINRLGAPLDIALSYIHETNFAYPLEAVGIPPLSVARIHTGTSQTAGHLHVTFTNSQNMTQRIAYLETPPWFIRFYLSTLKITIDDDPQLRTELLEALTYIPTINNRPTHFEPTLLLPPRSTVHLVLAFDKAFLRYTEHHPDAQRGWDLPPAVLVPLAGNTSIPRLYTPTLLVDLATPDFSMPYNVIIMSCTLIALLFGSIFNILTRTFVAVKVD